MLNYIVHIVIDFMYCMPDFVLTIIILTLSYLLLLNLGLQQELSTLLWAHCLLHVTLVRADWWVQQQSNTDCDHLRYDCRISDLIASMVCFDRFYFSVLSFWFDWISTQVHMYVSMTTLWRWGIVLLLILFVDLYSQWMTSILPPSNAFLY